MLYKKTSSLPLFFASPSRDHLAMCPEPSAPITTLPFGLHRCKENGAAGAAFTSGPAAVASGPAAVAVAFALGICFVRGGGRDLDFGRAPTSFFTLAGGRYSRRGSLRCIPAHLLLLLVRLQNNC